MSGLLFPPLSYQHLEKSRDALQQYARIVARVRRELTPVLPHWFHGSLRVSANGLTTTPIPYGTRTFELVLDLVRSQVVLETSRGEHAQVALRGQPVAAFLEELLDALAKVEIRPNLAKPDEQMFREDSAPREYDPAQIAPYWQSLSQVDILLKRFQGELRETTGAVQFWPHHFDLAMLWFSGKQLDYVNPNDEENSDEHLNFGYSSGDAGIAEPYFYVTAYPLPGGWVGSPLPEGAYWHTEGWNGAVLQYDTLAASNEPVELLLTFWRMTQRAGARAMEQE